MSDLTIRSQHACFGGTVGFYSHMSESTGTAMNFAVFTPPQASHNPVPVLTYLAGLTCTDETFMIKAGAQKLAAELGLMLVAPDTSPRGVVPAALDGDYDFGTGAGFYIDATQSPWSSHFRMESYITRDLPEILAKHFSGDLSRHGLFGHSMGGHGALTLALKHPALYRSVSAFAPIAAPSLCPWGEKAFTGYLGQDRTTWRKHDATALVLAGAKVPTLLIDQGLADQFLPNQLNPDAFENACQQMGQPLTLRRHAGYDHGYYFITSFIEDHLRHHAASLQG